MPGQTIHASVCFIDKAYVPKAKFHPDFPIRDWERIVGVGMLSDTAWADQIKDVLEMDLFDVFEVPQVLQKYMQEGGKKWSERLEFMSSLGTLVLLTWVRYFSSFPVEARVLRLC